MADAVRSTSGLGIAEPNSGVRSTYGLGERDKTSSVRSTYGLGQLSPNNGVRSTSGTGFVAIAGSAPTVAASGPLAVHAGTSIPLGASATAAPPSTVASYRWRIVSRSTGAPALALSATNVQAPTLLAVPSLASYTVAVGVVATDSTGRASSESVITITVRRAERVKATTAGWTLPVATGKATAAGWS